MFKTEKAMIALDFLRMRLHIKTTMQPAFHFLPSNATAPAELKFRVAPVCVCVCVDLLNSNY